MGGRWGGGLQERRERVASRRTRDIVPTDARTLPPTTTTGICFHNACLNQPCFSLIDYTMTVLSSSVETPELLAFLYKSVMGQSIEVDIYPPPPPAPSNSHSENHIGNPIRLPAVIYFHGGALTVGNRRSWFPSWLYRACRATLRGREPRTETLSVPTTHVSPTVGGWQIRPCGLLGHDLHLSGLSAPTACYRT